MKPLEIEVFFHTDQTTSLRDLDIQYNLSDCDVRKVTFYRIDAIGIFIDDDADKSEYSSIYSSGNTFNCPLKYAELKKLVEDNLK